MKLNNIDMAAVGTFVGEVKKDKGKAIKEKRVLGTWNFISGKPQFGAVLEHAAGKTFLEADAPPFLGGSGLKPDPMQYCLFGLAACFAQTFASVAAEKGVELTALSVSAEIKANLSQALGMGNDPVLDSVAFTVSASAADSSKLEEVKRASRERCPGVYCLTHPIRVEVKLKK